MRVGMKGRMLVGHWLENFVKSCTFGGLECAIDDGTFSTWSSPIYGNCFMFNFNPNSSKTVALPGPGYGLTLVLNLEQEHYGGITQTAGARVTVHSRNTPPLIEDNALMVEPNTATDIAIERVQVKRKSAPYGHCMMSWTETRMDQDAFEIFPGIVLPYSQGLCTRNCFFGAFATDAHCAHSKVVDLPDQQTRVWNQARICDLAIGSADYDEVSRVMEEFNNGTKVCPCEPPCEEEVFPASVSSVTWPSSKYKDTAARTYGVDKGTISENLVKINVYYTSLNEKVIEDEIDYDFKDGSLFNALGGCLSLWLGISFCNLFEILELLFD